jgi:hypothetical protein
MLGFPADCLQKFVILQAFGIFEIRRLKNAEPKTCAYSCTPMEARMILFVAR